MRIYPFLVVLCIFSLQFNAQLQIARDTLTVFENGYVLKMPWANGLNYANVSNIDLNYDGKKDLVLFDRINQFGTGRFRCFIKTGNIGEAKYRAAPEISYNFPEAANWAVLMDYNCDGKEDLFCSTNAGIKVYRNNSVIGTLTFTLFKSLLYTDYGGSNGKSNLYASSVGVPGISDIDGDGDLDILTFSPQGVFVEYHKNMSKERGYNCDSLVFEAMDLCWGRISESQCQVTMNQCLSRPKPDGEQKEYHAGSCLTCLDSDADGDKDLIMGDIACNTVHYVHNTGSTVTANFTDTTSLYPGYPNLSSTTQIRINNFPCTYYVNVDGDQYPDLIASPNAAGSENYQSVWYYRNASTSNTVNFQFVKKNFLQDEMIEVGQNSFPVTIDYNSDGKKDLLIGTFGYYQSATLKGKLTLYENISNNAAPVYSLITRDYGNLAAQNLNNVIPTVGDIDGDGDADILVGTSSGQIHWLRNSAGAGNVCNFSTFLNNPFTFTTSSAVAAPFLFDLNGDNLPDLLIGGKNGRVAYYKNIGTTTSPAYSLVTNTLGNIDVKGNPFQYGLDGHAVPFFYEENNIKHCMVGSISGSIWHYIVPANPLDPYVLMSSAENGLNEGSQSSVLFEDLDGDGKRDLMMGNGSGGLSYFSSSSPRVGIGEQLPIATVDVRIFPNPNNGLITVACNFELQQAILKIIDVSGRVLREYPFNGFATVDIAELQAGLYFCRIDGIDKNIQYSSTSTFIRQ